MIRTSKQALSALIVEDDEGMRDALTAVLLDEGYAPTAVGTVAEAHDQLRRQRPAVLLLDLELEDDDAESGTDLLGELVDDPEAPPTLVVSGALDARQIARAFCVRLVRKPSGVDRLVDEVGLTIDEERRPRRRRSRTSASPKLRPRDSRESLA